MVRDALIRFSGQERMESRSADSNKLDRTLKPDFTRGSRQITPSWSPFDVPITEFSQEIDFKSIRTDDPYFGCLLLPMQRSRLDRLKPLCSSSFRGTNYRFFVNVYWRVKRGMSEDIHESSK